MNHAVQRGRQNCEGGMASPSKTNGMKTMMGIFSIIMNATFDQGETMRK